MGKQKMKIPKNAIHPAIACLFRGLGCNILDLDAKTAKRVKIVGETSKHYIIEVVQLG